MQTVRMPALFVRDAALAATPDLHYPRLLAHYTVRILSFNMVYQFPAGPAELYATVVYTTTLPVTTFGLPLRFTTIQLFVPTTVAALPLLKLRFGFT